MNDREHVADKNLFSSLLAAGYTTILVVNNWQMTRSASSNNLMSVIYHESRNRDVPTRVSLRRRWRRGKIKILPVALSLSLSLVLTDAGCTDRVQRLISLIEIIINAQLVDEFCATLLFQANLLLFSTGVKFHTLRAIGLGPIETLCENWLNYGMTACKCAMHR